MSLAWTTLALTPAQDDLCAACVRAGVNGARVRTTRLPNFLAMPEDEARRALRAVCPAGRVPARVVFVAPAHWCAARPVAITSRQWSGAREEVLRSLDQMLPMTGEDALVGLVDLRSPDPDDGDDPTGGCLVGVRRRTAAAWTERIERVLEAGVGAVLSPHMAALGLGLQDAPEASVVEPGPGDVAMRLRNGRLVGVLEAPGDARRLALPGDGSSSDAETVTHEELAAAGAIAERVAPDDFRPLAGRVRCGAWRWLGPGLAAAMAGALLLAGFLIADARRAEAIDDMRAQRAALQDRFEESRRLGDRIERLERLLAEGVGDATQDWRSAMPVLRDIARAIERPAFLYRLDLSSRSVTLVGEAGEVRAVLQRLEESPTLTGVNLTDTLTPSPSDEALDVFSIRADRAAAKEDAP